MTAESDAPLDGKGPASSEALDLRSVRPALTVADIDTSLAWYRDVVGSRWRRPSSGTER